MQTLERLSRVAEALERIPEHRFVFVGASILPVLIDDQAAPPLRATVDVDIVVNIRTYGAWDRLRNRLLDCGFREVANPVGAKQRTCLFFLDDLEVDVMPQEERVLGFASQWLKDGYEHAELHMLPDGREILALSGPYFLATKLEAFMQRGRRDILVSKDLADIVSLLDGRIALLEDFMSAPFSVRAHVGNAFSALLQDADFANVAPGYLADQDRWPRLMAIMQRLAKLGS